MSSLRFRPPRNNNSGAWTPPPVCTRTGCNDPTQSWTLSLDVWNAGSTVYFIGDLVHDSNPACGTATITAYQGGWTT